MLRELLSCAFYAGLKTEEGRSLRGVLAFTGSTHPPYMPGPSSALVLEKLEPLEVAGLAKLLPALDPTRSKIGVLEHQGRLWVWGLLFDGGSRDRYLRSGGATIGQSTPSIDIVLQGPGRIVVEDGMFRCATFSDGLLVGEALPVLDESGPILAALDPFWQRSGIPQVFQQATHFPVGRVFSFPNVIRSLLLRTVTFAHGGLFLFVSGTPDDVLGSTGRTVGDGRLAFRDALLDAVRAENRVLAESTVQGGLDHTKRSELTDPAFDIVDDSLAAIAALSQIDGAVVFGPGLELLRFGATVRFPPNLEVTQLWRSPSATGVPLEEFSASRLGHRHRAAVALVHSQPQSVAFVVSQDGAVTALAHHQGRPTIWPNIALVRTISLPSRPPPIVIPPH